MYNKFGDLGLYIDGKRNGLHKEWYESGQLKYETNFNDGKLNGLYKEWYEDGGLKVELNYINGVFDGLVVDDFNNEIDFKEDYFSHNNKLLNGVVVGFYPTQKIKYFKEFENGKINGLTKYWYENDQLEYEGNYINNKKNGLHKKWYNDGQLAVSYTHLTLPTKA